ncbi:MAG: histidine phosphatase family protein [Actinobacteria bacterium]|nr:histidine phosphatase family protein [Actinomycetota bacterium]
MAALYFVRHGQTRLNIDRRYIGSTDLELTDLGVRQAYAVGREIRSFPTKISGIYTSPMKRTVQTVVEIKKCLKDLDVTEVADLAEVDFGLWEGMLSTEAEERYPEIYRQLRETPLEACFPEGGSFVEIRNRALAFIKGLAAKNPESEFIIVSHGGPIRMIIAEVMGLKNKNIWSFEVKHGSISKVVFEDKFSYVSYLNCIPKL